MLAGWITFDNRHVTMEEMSHQHMSNIYYFITLIVPQLYCNTTRTDVLMWLNKRFKGVILPYRPVPEFKEEKQFLQLKGYLQENNEIVVENQTIGSYA